MAKKMHPLSRLRIFTEARKNVFQLLDKDIITPERAEEILDYTKDFLQEIEEPQECELAYHHLGQEFPELQNMEKKFHFEELEALHKQKIDEIDQLLNNGEFEKAADLLAKTSKK